MLMEDGHFGLQRFAKVDDPDDVSLLCGAGLFPDDTEYQKYVREIVATSDEVNLSGSSTSFILNQFRNRHVQDSTQSRCKIN